MQATRFNHVNVHARNLENSVRDALRATLYLEKAEP